MIYMYRLLSDRLTSILNIYIITQSIMWPTLKPMGSIISYPLKGKSVGELSGQFTVFRKYNLYPTKSIYVRQYFEVLFLLIIFFIK